VFISGLLYETDKFEVSWHKYSISIFL